MPVDHRDHIPVRDSYTHACPILPHLWLLTLTSAETFEARLINPVALWAGISSRALRPTLGILDPLHLRTAPERVTAYTGIDVLW